MSSFSACDITGGPVGFSVAGRKDSGTDAALSWALSSLPREQLDGRWPCGAGGLAALQDLEIIRDVPEKPPLHTPLASRLKQEEALMDPQTLTADSTGRY